MKEADIHLKIRYRLTEKQKEWDEKWNRTFLPILHTYNESNNKEAYFTERIPTNKKDKLGRTISSSRFKIDFPAKKFYQWLYIEQCRLKGNFRNTDRSQDIRKNYRERGSRYKQLAMLNYLGVPHSQLNST